MSIEITQTSAGAHVQVKDTTTNVVNFFPCRQSTAIYASNIVPNGKIAIRYRDEVFFINVDEVSVPAGPWTALTLCQYLNDNFFVEPDGSSSVVTSGLLTGNGISNLVTYTFEGGQTSGIFTATPFARNNSTIDILTPGIPGRGPVVNIPAYTTGTQRGDLTSSVTATVTYGNVTGRRVYCRFLVNVTQSQGSGNCAVGIFKASSSSITGGMYLEFLSSTMRPVWHNGTTNIYGSTTSYSLNTWYDIELLWKYTGTQVQIEFWRDGIYINTLSYTVGAFNIPDARLRYRNAGAAANPNWNIQTELFAKSIYKV